MAVLLDCMCDWVFWFHWGNCRESFTHSRLLHWLILRQRRATLTTLYSYALFLDAAISTACRFFILEYIVGSYDRTKCRSNSQGSGADDEFDAIQSRCQTTLWVAHMFLIVALICFTIVECWLANSVRRYGKDLRSNWDQVEPGTFELSESISTTSLENTED